MAISRLIVEKFRNLNAVDLEFDHGFNFLVGNNGSGKTSLLEAIFLSRAWALFQKCGRKSHYFLRRTSFTLLQIQESQHQWSVGLQKLRQGNTIAKIKR